VGNLADTESPEVGEADLIALFDESRGHGEHPDGVRDPPHHVDNETRPHELLKRSSFFSFF
jgi:hypothetical protein